MYAQIMKMLGDVFDSGVEWFISVMHAAGMTSYFLAVVFLTLLSAYLLRPMFRAGISSGASDRVKKLKR